MHIENLTPEGVQNVPVRNETPEYEGKKKNHDWKNKADFQKKIISPVNEERKYTNYEIIIGIILISIVVYAIVDFNLNFTFPKSSKDIRIEYLEKRLEIEKYCKKEMDILNEQKISNLKTKK